MNTRCKEAVRECLRTRISSTAFNVEEKWLHGVGRGVENGEDDGEDDNDDDEDGVEGP